MSVLLAILYPEEKVADGALIGVEKLVTEGHIDLEDACAVTRDLKGKIHLHQETNLAVMGAVAGFALGTFFGWFVLMPYLGIPAAAMGAAAGKFTDKGINDHYMKDLGKELQPGQSALFLLLRSTTAERALEEIAPFGGRIFHTSLTKTDEARLEEMFESLQNKTAPEFDHSLEMHD